ncbi:MAG: selenocysteine protein [Calditrichaeota bacterium]|nr:MAG: selenocysteine protein [Calditrichota bacterium]
MGPIFEHSLKESLEITGLVFVMLVLMDLLYVFTRGKISTFLETHHNTQYVLSAFLGAIPGCEGAFLAVSLYAHGMISIGALLAAFVASSGDEALVMLTLFPKNALLLFALLAVLGVLSGWLFDQIYARFAPQSQCYCETAMFHPQEKFSMRHYFGKHIWQHLIREHMVKIFLWTLVAIFLIEWLQPSTNLNLLIQKNPYSALVTAAFFGLIPHSGPHLIFVTLYDRGTIPFSILLTNSIVQNGHALLPLLSISIRTSIVLKLSALVIGLVVGTLFFLLAG